VILDGHEARDLRLPARGLLGGSIHPVLAAKALATVDVLSQGRLTVGVGVGWLEAEFEALGVPFRERGRRMDEGIAMMRAVWSQDPVSFEAKVIASEMRDMTMLPQPISPIPMWHGSRSEAAHRRTVKIGDGWHGSQVNPEQAKEVVARLRRDRPEPEFTISVRSHWDGKDVGMMKERVAAYAEAGADFIAIGALTHSAPACDISLETEPERG
jgi:alkanesulfonate monooxygenase SsuD/methylene tetrahydromethanopterin reductase-like flavin-dependent oxidoreductase (luciferase family)